MAKWRYPGYLPKPPHEVTDFEWQSYKTGLSKEQMSERYSGITSDLIPTFEKIQAQGLGDINPDPYKRVSPFGPAFESKSISEIFYPDGNPVVSQGQLNSGNSQSPGFRSDNTSLQGSTSQGAPNYQYGLAKKIIDGGRAVVDGAQKVGEFVEDKLGTKEDPTAIRLGIEWVTGTGPTNRHLYENSRFVKEFRNSAGIDLARDFLFNKYDRRLQEGDSVTKYRVDFTYAVAGEAHTKAEQFIAVIT